MIDPRESFIAEIDLRECSVISKKATIFICGGPFRSVDESGDYLSLRDAIFNHYPPNPKYSPIIESLVKAEEFTELFTNSSYDNWTILENDLAGIATTVLIILESAGSIVELGMFSENDQLAEKCLALLPRIHANETSFIQIGVLENLKNRAHWEYRVYSWDPEMRPGRSGIEIEKEELETILDDLVPIASNFIRESRFSSHDHGHRIILVQEIISTFLSLKESEILRFMSEIDKDYYTKRRTTQILNFLRHMRYIEKVRIGDSNFYIKDDNQTTKSIKFKDSNSDFIDTDNITLDVREFYATSHSGKKHLRSLEIMRNR